jgi:hypothetical protein
MRFEGEPSTFRALQAHECPNPDDVVATFGKYAQNGAAIKAKVVMEVIEKSRPLFHHLGMIGEAGYNEAVIPLKDPDDPLGNVRIADILDIMEKRLAKIERSSTTQTSIQEETQDLMYERL